MDKVVENEIKAFVAERDAVLIEGNLEKLKAFQRKHNPGVKILTDDIVEMSLHKARTGALSFAVGTQKDFQAVANRAWIFLYGRW